MSRSTRQTRRRRHARWAARAAVGAGLLVSAGPAWAQFNQTGAGPYDYNTASNWVASTINGQFTNTLAANQTVTFAANTTLTTGWTFNNGGAFDLTLRGTGANRTVTLAGNVGMDSVADGRTTTIGSVTANQNLNVALGATRTFTVAGTDTLALVNVVSGATFGINKAGSGTLVLSGTNTYTGKTTISAGVLSVTTLANAGNNSSLGAASGANGIIDLGAGTLRYTGTTSTSNRVLNLTANNATVDVAGAGTVTLSNGLTGNFSFNKTGTGTLVLVSNSTRTSGTVSVTNGTLRLIRTGATSTNLGTTGVGLTLAGGTLALATNNSATTFGAYATTVSASSTVASDRTTSSAGRAVTLGTLSIGSSTLTATAGSNVSSGTATTVFGATTLTGDATFNVANTGSAAAELTLGALAGGVTPRAIGKDGAGTLLLSAAASSLASGSSLAINRGTVQLGAANALGSSGVADVTVNATTAGSTATLDLNSNNQAILGLTFGGTGGTATSTNTVTTGTGTLTLGGNVAYVATGNPLGAALSGNLALGSTTRTFDLADSSNATVELALSAVVSGTGGITKSGAGELELSAANTFSGVVTVNAGTLRASSNAAALGTNATATALTLAAGTVELANNTGLSFGRNTTVAGSAAVVSDRTSAGAGVTHTLGTLAIGAHTLTVSAGSNATSGTAGVTFGAATLSAPGTVFDVGTSALLTLASVSGSNTSFTVQGAGSTTISGAVGTGTGGLTKAGTGTLTLAVANTFSGAVAINAGTVSIQNAGGLGTTGKSVTVSSGGSLELSGATAVVTARAQDLVIAGSGVGGAGALRSVGGAHQWGGNVTLTGPATITSATAGQQFTIGTATPYTEVINTTSSGHTLTFDGPGDTFLNAAVNGTGTVIKNGSGTLTYFADENFYTGATFVNNGLLVLDTLTTLNKSIKGNLTIGDGTGAANSARVRNGAAVTPAANEMIINTAVVTLYSDGQYLLNDQTETIGSLASVGTGSSVALGAGNLITGVNNADASYSGVISGTGTLTKTGTGNQSLTGASTYTGATTVEEGTLTLSGGGTLAGTGATAFTLEPGGTLTLDNTGTNNTNRLTGAAPGITFTGGTFSFLGNNGANSSESLGQATFTGGDSTISIVKGTGAVSTVLTFSAFSRTGGTINFASTGGTLGTAGNNPRVIFSSGLAAGLIPNATVNGFDLAQYDATNGVQAAPTVAFNGTNNTQTTLNTEFAAGNPNGTLTLSKTVNALKLSPGTGEFISLGASGAFNLTVTSGTVLHANANAFEIRRSGTSTGTIAGTAYNFVVSDPAGVLTIAVPIATGANTVTKGGDGTLVLSATNTYSGGTILTAGTLAISADANLGSSGGITFNGGTLRTTSAVSTTRAVTLTGAGTVDTAGVNSTLAGVISGAGSLTKAGTGTLTVSAANTTTGRFITGTGVLRATTDAAALGAGTATNTVTLAGGTLSLANDTGLTFGRNTQVTANTLVLSDRLTLGAGVTHTMGNLRIGAQMLSIAPGTNVTSGTGTVAFGTTLVTDDPTFDIAANANLTLASVGGGGGDFRLTAQGAGSMTITGAVTLSGGGLTRNGTGTLTLNAAGTYTGPVIINGGTIALGVSNAIPTVPVTVGTGGTLALGTFSDTIGSLTLTGGSVTGSGASTLTVAGDISVTTTSTLAVPNLVGQATQVVNVSAGQVLTVNSVVGGASSGLIKTGAGDLTLSAANTYTGTTTVRAGTLLAGAHAPVSANGAFGNAASAIEVGDSSTLVSDDLGLMAAAAVTLARPVNVNAFGANATLGGTHTTGTSLFTGAITLARNVNLYAASGGTVTFQTGAISGPGFGVTKTGAGTVVLSGANTYSGGTTVNAGTLQLGASNAVPNAPVTVNSGATFDLATFNDTITTLALASGAVTGSGASTLTVGTSISSSGTSSIAASNLALGASLPVTVSGGVLTVSSVITGSGLGVTKGGPGTLVLGGANTFSGGTTINAGVVQAAADSAFGAVPGSPATNLTFGGGTLRFAAAFNLNTNRSIQLNSGGGTVDTNGFNSTFAGLVGGTGGLTKTGIGAFTLSAPAGNSYAGGTTVSGGRLVIANTSGSATGSGAVSVTSGGTLAGTGLIAGNVTVSTGGAISPGNSPGSQSLADGLNLAGGGLYDWETASLTSFTPGTDFDVINITGGNLVLGGTSKLSLTFGTGLAPDEGNPFWATAQLEAWKIIDLSGTAANPGSTNFASITNGHWEGVGYFFTTVGSGANAGDIFLNFQVPEPGTLGLLSLGAAALLRRRRRS